MKTKFILALAIFCAATALFTFILSNRADTNSANPANSPQSSSMHDHTAHNDAASAPTAAARVPAHFENLADAGKLPPLLSPEQFFGKARQAYAAAREIPETLALLPCYCYCDQSVGHKSLHSCYETDHSSHCAICQDEALMAYMLQKHDGLTPVQIRERIIAQYSQQQH